MKEFLKKIHTERFRWYDQILIAGFITILLSLFGQILGSIIEYAMVMLSGSASPFFKTFTMYFATIGTWIVVICHLLIFRHRRPILKAVGTRPKGNNLKYLLIGLLVGFGMNFFCAVVAMLHKDIHVSFVRFEPIQFLLLLFAVFVQSSSEELTDRAFYYQILRKGYRSKWVAIIGNALVFSLMHGLNPDVNFLGLLDIFFGGLMFSLAVYYFDSLWCAFGIHTGWNFTQSILLGLPNSGMVVPYSVFELDTANAVNSFVYDVGFGIEGTILAVIVEALVCLIFWYLGERRNQEPLDVWADSEADIEKE